MMHHIHTSYCSNCRRVTNLRVSNTLRTIPKNDGKRKTIVTKTYNCETCCSFVQSEDEKLNPLFDAESSLS